MFPIMKRVEVYKGKVIYIDMRESREKEESFRYERGDGTYAESWDKVTTFYDVTGKRLFLCVL